MVALYIQPNLVFMVLIGTSVGELIVNRVNEGLDAVPNDIHRHVTILQLNRNSITNIGDGDMADLLWLEKLYIDLNGISFISTNAFTNNIYLALLSFVGHQLTIFPIEFGGAWRSMEVVVCSVGPNAMQPVQLTHLPALKKLEMNTNHITNLTIGYAPSLKTLFAQWCGLVTFPNLSNATNLTFVHLDGNNFTQILPSAISGLTKLRRLSFSACGVRYLPDLSHLVSLEELVITDNFLASLPDLFHLPLTRLAWPGNPVVCDRALCWMRMWSSVKPGITDLESGSCVAPPEVSGLPLMSVHPVDMECFDGKCITLQQTTVAYKKAYALSIRTNRFLSQPEHFTSGSNHISEYHDAANNDTILNVILISMRNNSMMSFTTRCLQHGEALILPILVFHAGCLSRSLLNLVDRHVMVLFSCMALNDSWSVSLV